MTRYPYLVVFHDDSNVWLLSGLSNIESLRSRIEAGKAVHTTNSQPVSAKDESRDVVLNWRYIVGISAYPAVKS